jgi:hypothetical protein
MTPAERMYTVKPDTSVEDCMVLITVNISATSPFMKATKYLGLIFHR